jgi:putative ABC transport system permease protein
VYSQLNYWKSRPLGFNSDHVLTAPLFSSSINSSFTPGNAAMRERMNSFEENLTQHPNIEAITLASNMPGIGAVRHPITTDKIGLDEHVVLPCISADYDFVQTFDLKVIAGRNFGKNYGTDHIDGYLLNEKAVKTLGWDTPEDAIGQKIAKGSKTGKVLGVINDFHIQGLQEELEPVVLDINVGSFTTFAIRIKNTRLPETLDFLEKSWKTYFPEKAFEYTFLDEQLQDAYQDEGRLAQLVGYFAGIAIFLSCFGLFGLISFTVHQKAKEIGIRKVMGATVAGVVALLAKGYLKLVVIALVLATPIAWYLMDHWLDEFAYRISIEWWVFALSGAGAVVVAFLTVGLQSMKAALANPVDSLRNE